MRTHRSLFFALLAAFGLMTALGTTAAFAEEKEAKKVDVNSASAKELEEKLPGIGTVYAKKIVDGRPHKTAEDIVKAGVPKGTVDKIKDSISFGDGKVVARTPPTAGMVWVNKESKIYHKEGDQWYGKTKEGEWMTEEDAKKAGHRASK